VNLRGTTSILNTLRTTANHYPLLRTYREPPRNHLYFERTSGHREFTSNHYVPSANHCENFQHCTPAMNPLLLQTYFEPLRTTSDTLLATVNSLQIIMNQLHTTTNHCELLWHFKLTSNHCESPRTNFEHIVSPPRMTPTSNTLRTTTNSLQTTANQLRTTTNHSELLRSLRTHLEPL